MPGNSGGKFGGGPPRRRVGCLTVKVIIRQYTPADAEAVAAVVRETVPYMVTTPRTVHAQVVDAPENQRFRMLVAEIDDGRIVGTAGPGCSRTTTHPGWPSPT